MDIYVIELFATTAAMQNFSKAADTLAVTQSTLSQQIRRLEKELGYPLFIRQKGHRSVELTEQGQQFLTLASKIQDLWHEAHAIGDAKEQNVLRVSIMETIISYSLPQLIPSFLEKHPDTQLVLRNYYSKDALSHIESGNLDLAIVRDAMTVPGLSVTPLFSDPWVLVSGKGVYSFSSIVHPHQLDPARQIYLLGSHESDWNKRWFPESIGSSMISHSLNFINEATFCDGRWAVVPYTVARYMENKFNIEIRNFTDGPSHRMVYLATRSSRKSTAMMNFLSCLYTELHNVPNIMLMI